jgi:hypothetical protein
MTNDVGPISLASIVPCRRATTAPAAALRLVRPDWPRFGRARLLVVAAKVAPMLAIERASPSKIPSRQLSIADARIQIKTAAALSP